MQNSSSIKGNSSFEQKQSTEHRLNFRNNKNHTQLETDQTIKQLSQHQKKVEKNLLVYTRGQTKEIIQNITYVLHIQDLNRIVTGVPVT